MGKRRGRHVSCFFLPISKELPELPKAFTPQLDTILLTSNLLSEKDTSHLI